MRARRIFPAALLLTTLACDDGMGPPVVDEHEVQRPDYQLLVERYSRAGMRSFYVMSADGTLSFPLTNVPDDAAQLFPSPDGRTIAYLRNFGDSVSLWAMDREGDHRRAILAGDRVIDHVAWSPDGTRVLVAGSTPEETQDIWIINANGTGLTNLTPDPRPAIVADLAPSWSPDGTRIAFASNRSGTMHVWMMAADGSNPRRVVPTSVQGVQRSAAWSPDGTLIGFFGQTVDGFGVGFIKTDGTGYQFFPRTGDAGRVGWLPDGRMMFSTAVTGDYELYAITPATGATENLTRHTDHDYRATLLRNVVLAPWRGFAPSSTAATGSFTPSGIAIGDVVVDGFPDIMISAAAQSQLRVFKGGASGTFVPLAALDAPAIQQEILSADVTDDGADDIIVLGAAGFSVYRGSRDGPGAPTMHGVQGDARGLALRDLEGTGTPHIAVIADAGSNSRLRMYADNQQGTGTIVAIVDVPVQHTMPGRLCVGDITGGGHLDYLLVSASTAASLILLPARGDISLEAAVVMATSLGTRVSTHPVCADFDGDRRDDVALLDAGVRGVTVRRSLGNAFAGVATIDVVAGAMSAGDVDRDGDADLVIAAANESVLFFARNLGDARFAAPVRITIPHAATHIALADLDADGWLDVVTASQNGAVGVLLNRGR